MAGAPKLKTAAFEDENKSAFKSNRGDGLAQAKERALALAAEGRAVEIWVQHSDRLARGDGITADHLAEIWFALRRHGVRIRSVQDDSNLEDAIRVVLIGERNNEDSKRKAASVTDGLRREFARGKRGGGQTPDGYEVIRTLIRNGPKYERTWRINPERAPIIQRAFDLYEAGMGFGSVARELNRLGYRTPAGKPWERRRVQGIIGNYWYAGKVAQWGEGSKQDWRRLDEPVVTDGSHPALIDSERFNDIQKLRAKRDPSEGKERVRRGRPHKNHALATLAQCSCGEQMRPSTGSHPRKDGSRQRKYTCVGRGSSCDAPAVDAEVVDAAVIANLDKYLGDFDAWRDAISQNQRGEQQRLAREVERAESDLAAAEKKVALMEADYESHLEDGLSATILPLLEKRRADLERASKRLAASREALLGAANDTPEDDALLDFYVALQRAVQGRLDGADSMSKVNDALKDLFDHFTLTTTDAGVEVKPVLSQATAARIIDGMQEWPNGIEFAGRDVVREEQTGALISFGEPEEAALFEGAEIASRPAPTLTAKPGETPPLRAIQVPAKEFANSVQYGSWNAGSCAPALRRHRRGAIATPTTAMA